MTNHFQTAAARRIPISRAAERTALNFEMAYQIRVAIDKIRFAIKATESYPSNPAVTLETRMQLVDALQRLQSAERRFLRASQGTMDRASGCAGSPSSLLGT